MGTHTPASNPKLIATVTENVMERLLPMMEEKINEQITASAAANTSSNNVSLADDLAEAILAKISPKLDELIEAKLLSLGLISRQENGLFASFSKPNNLLSAAGQKFSPAVQYGQPPSYALITRMMHHAVLDTSTIAEKSKRAVIERIPEEIDADELVCSVAKKAGLEGQMLEDIHRHPRVKRNDGGKPRIVKVPFNTKTARDTFLREFRKSLLSLPNSPKNLIVRRDMTQEELKILYAIRREAYSMNKECGLFKFVVSDLQIIELKNPKPFRQA